MIDYGIIFVAFILSFLISTYAIRRGIPRLQSDSSPEEKQSVPSPQKPLPESSSTKIFDLKSTGFWIGLCETLLIFVLVYRGEFSALAIIIGAKEFVRKEKIQQNPSYYLLGTLINLSMAVVFVLLAKAIIGPVGPPSGTG